MCLVKGQDVSNLDTVSREVGYCISKQEDPAWSFLPIDDGKAKGFGEDNAVFSMIGLPVIFSIAIISPRAILVLAV